MADILDIEDTLNSEGLALESYDEILTAVQNAMTTIYATDGDTINFDSETPDGQFTNILAQLGSDIRELAREIYNSFNPDNCQGSVQDQRYALNYLTRKSGAYTIQPIEIKVNQTVTLQGLDESSDDDNVGAYTVSDDAGNLWFLMDTTTIEYIEGDNIETLPFRAQNKGDVRPTINTITNQVTKVLGVVSVNNPSGIEDLGSEEESDYEFRLRRNRSTAIKGQNNIDAMLGQILDLKGTTDATIWVNNTDKEDDKGVPAFSVWVVVDGAVANNDVAEVIYQNSAGLPTYSTNTNAVEIDVLTVAGQVFNVKFNRVATTNLYIKFDFKTHMGNDEFNDLIKQPIINTMLENISYRMGEDAETSSLTEIASQAILSNGGGGYALNLQISTDGTNYTDYIAASSIQHKFSVSNITINRVEIS